MKLSIYVNQYDEVLSQAEVIEHLEAKLKIAVEALEKYANDKDPDYIWARDNAFECLAVNHNHDDSITSPLGTWANQALEKLKQQAGDGK